MRYVNVTESRDELLNIVKQKERVIVTRNGVPSVVIIPFEEYQQLAAIRDATREPEEFLEAVRAHERVQRGVRPERRAAASANDPSPSVTELMEALRQTFLESSSAMKEEIRRVEKKVDRIQAPATARRKATG